MALTQDQREALGRSLYQALRTQKTIRPLIEQVPEIEIEDAYHISRAMLAPRIEQDGEIITGKKIGVTSDAVQKMLGVFQPDFGFLTNVMAFKDGSTIPIKEHLIQPRAEGEIAFVLKSDLVGPGVDESQVLAATDYITPCFEIVDSRIDNWKIAIQDTIADNASCGVYVLGQDRISPEGLALDKLEVVVMKNGAELSRGMGSAVQGNPLTAVAWLANTLGEFGIPLKAGEAILSGSLVPLESAVSGDYFEMTMTGEGIEPSTVSCRFGD
ncbi:MAG: hypothetical protein RI942_818 [Pseudomonadota bacterium]|jgi:2-oxopent-4-enoate/cis-2-oxohex-4-enoate hydratase